MLIRKKCFPISLRDDSVAVKAAKNCSGEKKKNGVPSQYISMYFLHSWTKCLMALSHRRKVKNNPEKKKKSLIFVTLTEFKWKAGAEEVLFTSILFHLSCLVESPGPWGGLPASVAHTWWRDLQCRLVTGQSSNLFLSVAAAHFRIGSS